MLCLRTLLRLWLRDVALHAAELLAVCLLLGLMTLALCGVAIEVRP